LGLIFINYRRRDEAYAAALLDEKLSKYFGSNFIFRASRSISAGADYEISILHAIEHCQVMLVVIGPNWSSALLNGSADIRDDWVRREISEAFKREIPVIPILLTGTVRLCEDDVPPDIARLARSQYLRFDYRNFEEDSRRIAHELGRAVPRLAMKSRRRILARLGPCWDSVQR
jgi:TIR domain